MEKIIKKYNDIGKAEFLIGSSFGYHNFYTKVFLMFHFNIKMSYVDEIPKRIKCHRNSWTRKKQFQDILD